MDWSDERRAEKREVMKLGQQIGYGNMMDLAQWCWRNDLAGCGAGGGEKVVGPSAASTVPCGCTLPAYCDWCAGCGWLTKQVKQVKEQDAGAILEAAARRGEIEPDAMSLAERETYVLGYQSGRKAQREG